jgi:hypothetical protein
MSINLLKFVMSVGIHNRQASRRSISRTWLKFEWTWEHMYSYFWSMVIHCWLHQKDINKGFPARIISNFLFCMVQGTGSNGTFLHFCISQTNIIFNYNTYYSEWRSHIQIATWFDGNYGESNYKCSSPEYREFRVFVKLISFSPVCSLLTCIGSIPFYYYTHFYYACD